MGIVERLRAAGCVFAEEEAELILATPGDHEAMVARRVAGLPLEHVLGWAEFRGIRVRVDPGVFVPRRRSGFLVERAAGLARAGDVAVDLCCGSGALGAALRAAVDVELYAADIDPAAVRCARRNVPGEVFEGDLFAPLPETLRGRVRVLLANVPYVPSGEVAFLPGEARDHEARVALDGGHDGLEVLRRVAAEAGTWLAPGGHLLTEASDRQAAVAVDVLEAGGLEARIARSDELDATVVIGTRTA
ncbi:putative protein N(5)-glutamine methyltransferase [Actinomadura parmotrematis]|uniref:Methyltransferase small domain-containing protein n=1 Tax=Actinomadura parmotrematis TaxID=2864039 RepID=A0ABS7FR71_9ACTN|nr:putative protein N(5)-glutamine methyltransferase [Actinomadura parmotrematis]MBW8482037.1 putative protein N(5)-glutamine methyltransferase [Actinomadura parmotrematis]